MPFRRLRTCVLFVASLWFCVVVCVSFYSLATSELKVIIFSLSGIIRFQIVTHWCSCLLKGKKIDANDLLKVLGAMGIELPEKELVRLRQTVPIYGEPYKSQNSLSGDTGFGGSLSAVLNCCLFVSPKKYWK